VSRLRFGAFLAPHHPVGEHPALQFQRDLDFVKHLDRLAFDEFYVGEHHSTGWESIAAPEMFLAHAASVTHHIGLGTGVVSLPYHHPLLVADRMVMLDHLSKGRAILGTGPGALASDAMMMGVDPMKLRDRQDEALGVILPLLRGETVSYECEWFTLREARLQLLPYQETLPVATASTISPSGMTMAGKYGIGVISNGSTSVEGLAALQTQWHFAEKAAAQHGQHVDRRNWRVLMSFHIAETRERAVEESWRGLGKWHNEYQVRVLGRPGAEHSDNPREMAEAMAGGGASGGNVGVIGTPDDVVAKIRELQAVSGGFGVLLGFVHDWADQEATNRSWDLFARYVVPEINGYTAPLRQSADWYGEHNATLTGAGVQAIVAAIAKDPEAMAQAAAGGGNPFTAGTDLDQVAAAGAGGPKGQ
jgi:limonene 1,2-monooxygenase